MAELVPWWVWLIPLARTFLLAGFVLLAGLVQGRSSGRYPTLEQWCEALRAVHRWHRPAC